MSGVCCFSGLVSSFGVFCVCFVVRLGLVFFGFLLLLLLGGEEEKVLVPGGFGVFYVSGGFFGCEVFVCFGFFFV